MTNEQFEVNEQGFIGFRGNEYWTQEDKLMDIKEFMGEVEGKLNSFKKLNKNDMTEVFVAYGATINMLGMLNKHVEILLRFQAITEKEFGQARILRRGLVKFLDTTEEYQYEIIERLTGQKIQRRCLEDIFGK